MQWKLSVFFIVAILSIEVLLKKFLIGTAVRNGVNVADNEV